MYKLAYTERFKKAFNDLTNNEQILFQNEVVCRKCITSIIKNKKDKRPKRSVRK